MLQYDLNADVRNTYGKCAARSMRRDGMTPAILYGPKSDAISLKLNTKSLTKTLVALQRRNAVFNLEVNDGASSTKRYAIVKEVQAAPISGDLVHADFLEVKLDEPMIFDVPVKYIGVAKGVDLGGEMHIALTSVKLKGLILDIPDFLEIVVSDMSIGDRLHCSDLVIPSSLEMLNELDATCVAIVSESKAQAGAEEAEAVEEVSEEGSAEESES
nr:50S ribosomal protein L25 [Desulfobulbaceae bacterium]